MLFSMGNIPEKTNRKKQKDYPEAEPRGILPNKKVLNLSVEP